jgi:hypothetical protein
VIDEKYLNLLKKGAKFNINPTFNKNSHQDLIIDLDIALDDSNKYKCAKLFNKNKSLCKSNKNNKYHDSDQKTICDFKKFILDKNIVCTKADKGNSIVLLYKQEYHNKITEIISDTTTFQKLLNDPTDKFNKRTKEAIKKSKTIDQSVARRLTIMNPKSPQLYGLTKIHKDNNPMRPVVSYVNSPAYLLAKYLNTLILEVTQFKPKYGLKNSMELCQYLKEQTPPKNALLVSFDVKSLFTNVPVEESIECLSTVLNNCCDQDSIKEDIINLVKTCIHQSYFCFEEEYYEQNNGLPMGNPLSPILADIFMSFLENKLLDDSFNSLINNIFCYKRYVDDIFFIFKGTRRQLARVLDLFNSQHHNIKFTHEIGEQQSINFLDINIKLVENNFEFKIYRKDTFTDNIIPADSHHPDSYKMAAFNSMIHRLMSIPLTTENYNAEIEIIKTIARNNGYKTKDVDIRVKKKMKQLTTYKYLYHKSKKHDAQPYRRVLYINNKTAEIVKKFKSDKFKPAFYTNNSIKRYIMNNKSKIMPLNNSGVYKIKCENCEKVYIGQTGRKIVTRAEEHLKAVKNFSINSEMADHVRETGHNFNINSFNLVKVCDKGYKLTILENLHINNNVNNNLINVQIPPISSPLLKTLLAPPSTSSLPHRTPPPPSSASPNLLL